MVRKGNLAVFEGSNIFETRMAMPTKIGVHIFDIKLYLHDFFLQARVARLQVLRLFWCPRDLCFYIYIYVCPHLKIIMPFIHVVLEECTP